MIKWEDNTNPYYDKDGEPITFQEYVNRDQEYKRVAETTVVDGRWVSTVWLGLDHNYGDGKPLIFETMVFKSERTLGGSYEYQVRYHTEEEALIGHKITIEFWNNRRKVYPYLIRIQIHEIKWRFWLWRRSRIRTVVGLMSQVQQRGQLHLMQPMKNTKLWKKMEELRGNLSKKH